MQKVDCWQRTGSTLPQRVYAITAVFGGTSRQTGARPNQVADYCPKGLVDLEETNHHANTDVPHKTDATVV